MEAVRKKKSKGRNKQKSSTEEYDLLIAPASDDESVSEQEVTDDSEEAIAEVESCAPADKKLSTSVNLNLDTSDNFTVDNIKNASENESTEEHEIKIPAVSKGEMPNTSLTEEQHHSPHNMPTNKEAKLPEDFTLSTKEAEKSVSDISSVKEANNDMSSVKHKSNDLSSTEEVMQPLGDSIPSEEEAKQSEFENGPSSREADQSDSDVLNLGENQPDLKVSSEKTNYSELIEPGEIVMQPSQEVASREEQLKVMDNPSTPEQFSQKGDKPAPCTIEDLKMATGISDQQLDTEIEDKDTFKLAANFDDLLPLLDELDLSVAKRSDLIRIAQTDTQKATSSALKEWRKVNPLKTTIRELVIILITKLRRGDIALEICKYATEKSMLTESSMTTVISESVNDTEELSVSVQSDTSSCFSVSEDDSESDSEINDDFTNLYELAKSKPTIATMTKPARESTKKMRGKFGALIVKIKESMERNKKSVNDLILFLAEIETLDPVSTTVGDSCLLFNAETIREFRTECERIEDVFIRLKGYYSWFNYRLVKDIANAFCENDEKVTNELKKYKKIFKKYCQKRLCHLPDESSPPARDTQLCVFTIDADWRTMKINQVKPVKTIIRQVLGLRKITLRLRAARNGSVKLVFDIPKHVADVVFPLAENQVMSLKEHRIQFKEILKGPVNDQTASPKKLDPVKSLQPPPVAQTEATSETKKVDLKKLQEKITLAIENGDVEVIQSIVNEKGVDITVPFNESGETVLGLAIRKGKIKIVKYLVSKCGVAVDEKHLLTACEGNDTDVVHYLLADLHINPNVKSDDGKTPLTIARNNNNREITKLLLQHGADADDVYAHHKRVLGNFFATDPLKSPTKMFVIGHVGEGKSTLIEAIKLAVSSRFFVPLDFLWAAEEIKGINTNTVGIIPQSFKSPICGDIIFYELAGQDVLYTRNAAILSLAKTPPTVFVLVVSIHRDDTDISQSIFYWLGVFGQHCALVEGKVPLIIVGSHIDSVEDNTEVVRKQHLIRHAVEKFTSFNLVEIILMNCCRVPRSTLKVLRLTVGSICNSIQPKISVKLNSHMFFIYLCDTYPNVLAVTLEDVLLKILTETDKQNRKHKKILQFIPTTIKRLAEVCVQLSNKGHIFFLANDSSLEESIVIIDQQALFSKINGTIFAPEHFKHHCKLPTSTGMVSQSKISPCFPTFKSDTILQFLSFLEFIVPVEDSRILSLIKPHVDQTRSTSTGTVPQDSYFFCPAFVPLEIPPRVFVHEADFLFHFGWTMACINANEFFDAKFLHILISRLALSVSPALVVKPDIPALQHQCSVWKTGVCWNTPQGFEVLVEVMEKKKVIILIQAHDISYDLLKLQSTVLQKVLEITKEYCSTIATEQFLFRPTDVTYPPLSTTLFSMKAIARSVIDQAPFIVSNNACEHQPINVLLPAEVYTNLGENVLQLLFNENNPVHNTKISDRFFSALSASWSKNPQLLTIICSILSNEEVATPSSKEDLELILYLWSERTDGTYKSLKKILDPLSVFAGRNPLVLAGVPLWEFTEELLPGSSVTSQTAISPAGEFRKRLSIVNLIEESGVNKRQIDMKIHAEDLSDLAACFDIETRELNSFLDQLGLTVLQMTHIEDLAKNQDLKTVIIEALKLWRQPNPFAATFRALLEILLDLRRGDIAVKVCDYITESVPKQK